MDSRRKFLQNSFMIAGSAAIPVSSIASTSNDNKSTAEDSDIQLEYKNTYVKNIFVTENEFRSAKPTLVAAPSFQQAKEILPVPYWKGNTEAIDMYWKAWEIAFKNIKNPAPKSGFIASYIDTAYNGNIFMWDSK